MIWVLYNTMLKLVYSNLPSLHNLWECPLMRQGVPWTEPLGVFEQLTFLWFQAICFIFLQNVACSDKKDINDFPKLCENSHFFDWTKSSLVEGVPPSWNTFCSTEPSIFRSISVKQTSVMSEKEKKVLGLFIWNVFHFLTHSCTSWNPEGCWAGNTKWFIKWTKLAKTGLHVFSINTNSEQKGAKFHKNLWSATFLWTLIHLKMFPCFVFKSQFSRQGLWLIKSSNPSGWVQTQKDGFDF